MFVYLQCKQSNLNFDFFCQSKNQWEAEEIGSVRATVYFYRPCVSNAYADIWCIFLSKTVKLHEKLGKPIPEVLSAEAQDKDKKKDGTVKTQAPKPSFRNNQRRNRKPSAPKITFIGGTTLNTSAGETTTAADATETPDAETATAAATDEGEKKAETPASEEGKESKFVGML